MASSVGEGSLPSPAPWVPLLPQLLSMDRPPAPPPTLPGLFLEASHRAFGMLWRPGLPRQEACSGVGPLPAGLRWVVTSISECQTLSSEGPRTGPGPEHLGELC